jgi:group I intron endonuclease
MEDNNTHLYLHTKKGTSEVFYVGIGNSQRPYRKGKKRNQFWNNIVNKYGYEITILSDSLTWEQACELEIYLIKYYGRRDLGTGTLVNLTDGGGGPNGYKHSKETKAKMSRVKKGKKQTPDHIANAALGRKGRIVSAETRAKMSKGRKGIKHSEEAKAKMSELMKGAQRNVKLTEDQVIEILIELRDNPPYYGQLTEMGERYGVDNTNIYSIKKNKSWTHICRETLTIKQEEPYRN